MMEEKLQFTQEKQRKFHQDFYNLHIKKYLWKNQENLLLIKFVEWLQIQSQEFLQDVKEMNLNFGVKKMFWKQLNFTEMKQYFFFFFFDLLFYLFYLFNFNLMNLNIGKIENKRKYNVY